MLEEHSKEDLETSDQLSAQNQAKCVRSELRYAVALEWTTEMDKKLTEIFKRAQAFYRLVYCQQSQLEIIMLKAKVEGKAKGFHPEKMEVVNGMMDDEDALSGSPIEISVFPAVFKLGSSSSTSVSCDHRNIWIDNYD